MSWTVRIVGVMDGEDWGCHGPVMIVGAMGGAVVCVCGVGDRVHEIHNYGKQVVYN